MCEKEGLGRGGERDRGRDILEKKGKGQGGAIASRGRSKTVNLFNI